MLEGLHVALEPMSILIVLIGAFVGIIIGIIPGIGAGVGMSMMLPLIFTMNPTLGLMFLLALWAADGYGASVSSILLNVPGGSGAVVTCFDGYPLARQGKAGLALGYSIMASAVGGIIGVMAAMIFSPLLVRVALLFGPAEFFLLAILGLTVISTMMNGQPIKGLIAAGLGLMISFVGFDLVTGFVRFSFGSVYVYNGFEFTVVLAGLFAVARMISLFMEGGTITGELQKASGVVRGMWATFKYPKALFSGSFIGTIMGTIPGVGIAAASAIAYNSARNGSKEPELFGKGAPEGVISPEAANNAVQGGHLIPTLTLGIPGSSTAAIFLGALVMYGVQPGMDLFKNSGGSLVWAILWGLVIANIAFVLLGAVLANQFAKLTLIPGTILVPIVLILIFIGSYTINNDIRDVAATMIFGVLGFVLLLLDYPIIPAVLALILGPIAEVNYFRSMLISDGSWSIFTSKVSLILIFVIIISIVYPFWQSYRRKKKALLSQSEAKTVA